MGGLAGVPHFAIPGSAPRPTEESPLGCVGSRQPATCGVPPRLVPAVDSDSLVPASPALRWFCESLCPQARPAPSLSGQPHCTSLTSVTGSSGSDRAQRNSGPLHNYCVKLPFSFFFFIMMWEKKKKQSFLSMNLAPR